MSGRWTARCCLWASEGALCFTEDHRPQRIPHSEILYLEVRDKHCHIFTVDGGEHVTAATLAAMTEQLTEGFYLKGFKVHWAQLVYVFPFLQNASTLVNTISFMVNQLALGHGAVINFVAAPSYSALIVLLNIPTGIFVRRYFIHTVRHMFEGLSPREALALCGIPAMFLMVSTFMTVAQKHGDTAEFDCAGGLSRASVILFMGQPDA